MSRGVRSSLMAAGQHSKRDQEKPGAEQSPPQLFPSSLAIGLRRIGTTLQETGQLDRAIGMHLEALRIDQAMQDLQGMASDYGNLGVASYLMVITSKVYPF
jgi:hypothetical protein